MAPASSIRALGSGQFRSGSIHLVSPIADQKIAPAEFRWNAVQGASSYTVELKDVAGITLATAKSSQNVLPVTPEMRASMISDKPLKWKVTALDASRKRDRKFKHGAVQGEVGIWRSWVAAGSGSLSDKFFLPPRTQIDEDRKSNDRHRNRQHLPGNESRDRLRAIAIEDKSGPVAWMA